MLALQTLKFQPATSLSAPMIKSLDMHLKLGLDNTFFLLLLLCLLLKRPLPLVPRMIHLPIVRQASIVPEDAHRT